LSKRHGLQVPNLPALVTTETPLAADIVGCPGGIVNDGPQDGRLWVVATIDEIDAEQRIRTGHVGGQAGRSRTV